ncbi:unnamed protein product [Prunus brigantina]
MLSGVISACHVKLDVKEYAEQQQAVLSGRTTIPGQQVFPLKLVLMSATLRIEDFINNRKLFRDPPPVIDVSTRQFPCYELSNSPLRFRNDNALHPTIMQEIIFMNLGDVKEDWRVSHDKKPLSVDHEKLLRQAICAGWADRVATRIGSSKSGDRKVRAVGYEACMVDETVYLDHRSSVPAPEFLVYTELIQTSSGPPLMHGVTCVEPEWLVEYAPSFCTSSAHIEPYCYLSIQA